MAKAKSDEKTAPTRTASTKAASAPQSRRDKLASLEAARKKEQRSRSIKLLAICLVLAIALLAYPVYLFVDDYRVRNASLEDIGSSVAAAGCDSVAEHQATGNQDHVAEGTKVNYSQTPPDSGAHYPSPAPFTKHFYAEADRPPVETLVHNLEHGYTVVWYRADAPGKQIKNLQAIAKTFGSDNYDPAEKFIAAPWSDADGAGFLHVHDTVLGGAGVAGYADIEQRHPAGRSDQLRRLRLQHQGGNHPAQAHRHLH